MNIKAAIWLGIILLVGSAPAANAFQGRGHKDYDRRYEQRRDRGDHDDDDDGYDRHDDDDDGYDRHDRYNRRYDRDHRGRDRDRYRYEKRRDYYKPPKGYRHVRDYHIPRGHLPPPGWCRVWYVDRPAGHQPPPVSCYSPAGHGHAWVIVTHDGYVYGSPRYYERHRHARRPEIIIRGEIRF